MELLIGAAVCAIAVAVGLPSLLPGPRRDWFWGGIAVLGMLGLLAVFVWSVWRHWGNPVTYEEFHPGAFFFFILLGMSAGLWFATTHHAPLVAAGVGVAGALTGYVLGIFAGLWLQALGPLAIPLGFLSYVGVIALGVIDLILIFAAGG
jgi:hypothetical protein